MNSALFTQYGEGFSPTISPDGKEIIVTRNNRTSGRGEIWSIHIESGQETLILSDSRRGFSSPRISPDGKKIVCVGISPGESNKPLNLDLYLVSIDGTGLTQVTFHPGSDVSPVWGPEGDRLYFISQRGNSQGAWNVWSMNVPEL